MAKKQKRPSILNTELAIGRVSLAQKVVFAKHLAVMLSSGMLITEALEITADAAKGKMKSVIRDMSAAVGAGNSLADALASHNKVFSDLFIDVVRAGEASGNLPKNLEHISTQLEKEMDLITKIKSAMTYPSVIFVAAIALALGMSYFVLPQILPLFTGLNIELPWTTRAVIWFSELVSDRGAVLFPATIAVLLGCVWLVRQPVSRPVTHLVLLHVPILKIIIRNSNLARFTLTLGTLLESGLPIDDALAITERTVSNLYYRRAVQSSLDRVATGGSLHTALASHSHLFPSLTTSMIRVGEESGSLDESLLYLSNFYEREVDSAAKTLTTALEPILLAIIGVVVGTLALSIITPIYEITGNIRR